MQSLEALAHAILGRGSGSGSSVEESVFDTDDESGLDELAALSARVRSTEQEQHKAGSVHRKKLSVPVVVKGKSAPKTPRSRLRIELKSERARVREAKKKMHERKSRSSPKVISRAARRAQEWKVSIANSDSQSQSHAEGGGGGTPVTKSSGAGGERPRRSVVVNTCRRALSAARPRCPMCEPPRSRHGIFTFVLTAVIAALLALTALNVSRHGSADANTPAAAVLADSTGNPTHIARHFDRVESQLETHFAKVHSHLENVLVHSHHLESVIGSPARADKRCGAAFNNAECDPDSEEPCCSRFGYCGATRKHCDASAREALRKRRGQPPLGVLAGQVAKSVRASAQATSEIAAAVRAGVAVAVPGVPVTPQLLPLATPRQQPPALAPMAVVAPLRPPPVAVPVGTFQAPLPTSRLRGAAVAALPELSTPTLAEVTDSTLDFIATPPMTAAASPVHSRIVAARDDVFANLIGGGGGESMAPRAAAVAAAPGRRGVDFLANLIGDSEGGAAGGAAAAAAAATSPLQQARLGGATPAMNVPAALGAPDRRGVDFLANLINGDVNSYNSGGGVAGAAAATATTPLLLQARLGGAVPAHVGSVPAALGTPDRDDFFASLIGGSGGGGGVGAGGSIAAAAPRAAAVPAASVPAADNFFANLVGGSGGGAVGGAAAAAAPPPQQQARLAPLASAPAALGALDRDDFFASLLADATTPEAPKAPTFSAAQPAGLF